MKWNQHDSLIDNIRALMGPNNGVKVNSTFVVAENNKNNNRSNKNNNNINSNNENCIVCDISPKWKKAQCHTSTKDKATATLLLLL